MNARTALGMTEFTTAEMINDNVEYINIFEIFLKKVLNPHNF